MGSLPPVANAALAFGAGVALTRFGALWSIAPLIGSVLVLLPIHLSRRPSQSWVCLPLLLAGLFAGSRGVLGRLGRVGALVSRTDLDGTIRVIGRRDGSYSIIGARD